MDVCMTLSQECNGLSARRMAVWDMVREPSLYRHAHRELLRSAVLDLTPIIPRNCLPPQKLRREIQ